MQYQHHMMNYSIYTIKKGRLKLSSFCQPQLYPAASSHTYTDRHDIQQLEEISFNVRSLSNLHNKSWMNWVGCFSWPCTVNKLLDENSIETHLMWINWNGLFLICIWSSHSFPFILKSWNHAAVKTKLKKGFIMLWWWWRWQSFIIYIIGMFIWVLVHAEQMSDWLCIVYCKLGTD